MSTSCAISAGRTEFRAFIADATKKIISITTCSTSHRTHFTTNTKRATRNTGRITAHDVISLARLASLVV